MRNNLNYKELIFIIILNENLKIALMNVLLLILMNDIYICYIISCKKSQKSSEIEEYILYLILRFSYFSCIKKRFGGRITMS